MQKNPAQKIVTTVVGLSLLLGASLAPRTAEASGAPVLDALNLVENTFSALIESAGHTKEYILDTLVWEVGNLAIQSITRSVVNWINSGFQGSPAFVTDLQQNLRGVGDAAARRFFDSLASQDITDTPGQDRVLDAVRLAYYLRTSPESFYTRYPNTLSSVTPDPDSYLAGDFSKGGWNAWFETVINPQNNPFGAQDLLNRELNAVVSGATNDRLQELSWNNGFLSWRGECITAEGEDTFTTPEGEEVTVDFGIDDPCLGHEVRTPGSVIMEQLNDRLGDNVNRLVSADEFNEIIGALLNQLVLQVLGGGDGGGGLSGLSQPTSGGGSSFINRSTSPSNGGSNGISNTFNATITRQLEQLREFEANWQRIRTAAERAEAQCGAGGDPDPAATVTLAGSMLVKAANAIAALEEIQREIEAINAAGGNQSVPLLGITERYNELMNSGTLPTPEEIAQAKIDSTDTGEEEPASLYTALTRMANSSCNASDD